MFSGVDQDPQEMSFDLKHSGELYRAFPRIEFPSEDSATWAGRPIMLKVHEPLLNEE